MRLKIPPLVVVLILGLLMLGSWRLPLGHFDFPGNGLLAVILIAIGIVFTGLGAHRFRVADTTVDPLHPDKASSLVTRGVYGFTRNPMYLGFGAVLLGWVFWLGTALAFLALPLYVLWMNAFQIAWEEQALSERFGKAYEDYRRRVRRWI